jgi:hypothetical protein
MEDSVKLTDTQRRLLAAASQRDDGALKRPSRLPGNAAGKAVAKLLAEGLIEEVQSLGPLPVWRRDGDNAHTLRITRRGRQAIRVDDEAAAADELPKKPPAQSAKSRKSTRASVGGRENPSKPIWRRPGDFGTLPNLSPAVVTQAAAKRSPPGGGSCFCQKSVCELISRYERNFRLAFGQFPILRT